MVIFIIFYISRIVFHKLEAIGLLSGFKAHTIRIL
jgi:hypothetical protein